MFCRLSFVRKKNAKPRRQTWFEVIPLTFRILQHKPLNATVHYKAYECISKYRQFKNAGLTGSIYRQNYIFQTCFGVSVYEFQI